MHRFVLGLVCLASLLISFGLDVRGFIYLWAMLLVIAGGYNYMLRGNLPQRFWLMLVEIAVGPFILTSLCGALLSELGKMLGPLLSPSILMIALPVLMTGSFLYVRARINGRRHAGERQLTTNERQQLLPASDDRDNEDH